MEQNNVSKHNAKRKRDTIIFSERGECMNKVWFFVDLCLIPVYFTMVLAMNVVDALFETFYEVARATAESKRKYQSPRNVK